MSSSQYSVSMPGLFIWFAPLAIRPASIPGNHRLDVEPSCPSPEVLPRLRRPEYSVDPGSRPRSLDREKIGSGFFPVPRVEHLLHPLYGLRHTLPTAGRPTRLPIPGERVPAIRWQESVRGSLLP